MTKKYLVEIGYMYFVEFCDFEVTLFMNDNPGAFEHAKKFDTKEEAEKVAEIIGGHVVTVISDEVN
ncbi:hypothetical protein NHG29_01755 [Aerococcaceae bacterium NML160702]|nr:hypothetical protein [Aerococcaceae bacterium NML160702]